MNNQKFENDFFFLKTKILSRGVNFKHLFEVLGIFEQFAVCYVKGRLCSEICT